MFFLSYIVKNDRRRLSIIIDTQDEELDKFLKILSPILVNFSLANFFRISSISYITKFLGLSTYLTNYSSKDKIHIFSIV